MNGFSLRSRRVRRFTAAAHYVSFAGAFVLVNLHIYTDLVGWALVSSVLTYLASGLCLMAVAWPYGISGARWKPGPKIDERQSRVRANALAYSYWITSLLIFVAFAWIAIARSVPRLWRPNTVSEWWWVFWIGVMVNSMLPSAIIAWSEPDLPEEAPAQTALPLEMHGEAKLS